MKHLPRDRCKPGLAPAGDSLSLASPRESKQREGDPMVWVPPLRYGQPTVLAESGGELELAALRQSLALIRFWLRSSAQPDGWLEKKQRTNTGRHDARSAPCRSQAAVMFARGSSTRGQMKSPSIAQRGEGGDRGGSGELKLLSVASRSGSVMPPAGQLKRPFGGVFSASPRASEQNPSFPESGREKSAIYFIANRSSSP